MGLRPLPPLQQDTRPGHIEWMVDQVLRTLDELIGFGQLSVPVKGPFIDPAGMKKEQPWVAYRAVDFNAEAARLLTNARNNVTQFRRNCRFISLERVKAREDCEFHRGNSTPTAPVPPPTSPRAPLPRPPVPRTDPFPNPQAARRPACGSGRAYGAPFRAQPDRDL